MTQDLTLSKHQVVDALIDYIEKNNLHGGSGFVYDFSFKQEIVKLDDGSIEITFKGVNVKVSDYSTRHKKG